MSAGRGQSIALALLTLLILSGCGKGRSDAALLNGADVRNYDPLTAPDERKAKSIFSVLSDSDDPNTTVEVNKYIWSATLDILNFLPIESADPFSGVIVTGYGTPPGGGRAYKATVLIQDPALDARSLKLALMTKGGPASPETIRAVEDAILTRARQLRIRDGKL